ncbi:MAG: hypothetical protein IPQ07_04055 [Myxococcales bacterium]|nr:hypothetical protein [Myxococcales bacterium]
MRLFGVLMLMSGLAMANPAPAPGAKVRIPLGPSKTIEVEPWTPPARAAQTYRGVTGQPSAAVVIDPGPHGDAQPWPYGIWIRPPGSSDANVIDTGTNHLPGSEHVSARLSRALDLGVGQFLEWLMTPRFVRRG